MWAQYHRSMNELRISQSLKSPLDFRFDIEIRALLDAAEAHDLETVVVGLCGLDSIGSQYVGALAAGAAEPAKSERNMTIRAKGRVAQLPHQCGVDKVAALEIE